MNRRSWLQDAIPAALAACLAPRVLAQAPAPSAWPSRPLRMIVPGGAGSGTDVVARVFAEPLSRALRQPVVVENRPGANGIVGNNLAAKAAPDGYTILFSNASAIAINAAMRDAMPYDTLRDLAPVIQVSAGGVLLVATAETPVRDLASFVEYVRAHPNIAYGTWGVGSTGHLAMEAIARARGLRMRHIPYKTMGQLLTDLQGGVISLAFVDARSPLSLIQAGKLVPLAMTGTRRSPMLPEVRTLKQQGFDLDLDGWYGVFVPAHTPAGIVLRLNEEIARVMVAPALQASFAQQGLLWVERNAPEQFARVIRSDIRAWKALATTARVQVD
ncbi:Bug family tripartite tricarboxylate transporter substrate binding protein [Cupriavidus oxalaticus]|uniref:Tripartite tricarboxylate transporter substrate binding protein n=1 Tax=Cupriavidus oxalaticus TaxID=96344 RepID=A0A5P3VHE7_9BURK|nr:tripartite tricarboxylate transporter substrate binding protein [Cupriavidus oxalaticus]QEZ45824.1 tripartite tricarboxylate transporter substrate binding protein [Cupriavidus oxalaticus]